MFAVQPGRSEVKAKSNEAGSWINLYRSGRTLDEATAALDEDSQRRVMRLFDDELKQTTVLSIGHRPDLAVYHTRTLQLVHGQDGDRLKLKPPPAPPPPRRWLQRFDDWLLTIRS